MRASLSYNLRNMELKMLQDSLVQRFEYICQIMGALWCSLTINPFIPSAPFLYLLRE